MRVNIDLSDIQSKDTIIAANNRQALAIKQSMRLKVALPKCQKYSLINLGLKSSGDLIIQQKNIAY
jgi:hypothetical protein